jgi:hypothetical protein
VEHGLIALAAVAKVPKTLTLREAAQADGASPTILVEKLGDFFETRRRRSFRK